MSHKVIAITRVAVLLILCLFTTECGRVKRVVGGMEVACGNQPRVASLRNYTTFEHLCGATILSPHFALTAAHCVHFQADQYTLQLNNYCVDEDQLPPRGQVLEIVTHELYNRRSSAHDMALLRILLDTDEDDERAVCLEDEVLPQSSFGLSGLCSIYGYGSKYPGIKDISETLLTANVRIMSLDNCIKILGPIAPEHDSGMVCAIGEGADSCQGDSGSPLMCGSLIEGISSHGLSCGAPGVPGVYTSVGAHLKWIRGHMAREGDIDDDETDQVPSQAIPTANVMSFTMD